MKARGFIFDLDGVIVDTADFHYLAWRDKAKELGFELTPTLNEKLKGVSRIESLQKILDWSGIEINEARFTRITTEKNKAYLEKVETMTRKDILPGVYDLLLYIKANGFKVSLGSASKNAHKILEKVGLLDFFDVIIDGNSVSKAKPNPEVFLVAAKGLNCLPKDCVVFEDSSAGVEAANKAGMVSVGIGSHQNLGHAQYLFEDFTQIKTDFIKQLINT